MRHRRRIEGLGLVEVVIASALGAVAMIGTMAALKHYGRGIATLSSQMTRNAILDRLWHEAGTLDNLSYTALDAPSRAAANAAFTACVDKTFTAVPCRGNVETDFEVYLHPKVAGGPTERITGASGAPVYFDKDGAVCSKQAPGPGCNFAGWTTFTATCAGGAATCNPAESIAITAHVRNVSPLAGMRLPMRSLDRRVGSIPTWEIMAAAVVCPPGLIFQGFKTDASPVCTPGCAKGANGRQQYFSGVMPMPPATDDHTPVCTDVPFCPRGQFIAAIGQDGSPDCQAVPDCPANQYFIGMDLGVTPPAPKCGASPACAAGHFYAGLNADGTVRCDTVQACPPGTFFQAMSPDNTPRCSAAPACPAGKFYTGINPDGTPSCQDNPATDASCGRGSAMIGFDLSRREPQCLPATSVSCPAGYVPTGFDALTGMPVCTAPTPPPTLVAKGALGFDGANSVPCTALEDHSSTGFSREHWKGVATCPAGYVATGGGGYCGGRNGGVLEASYPDGNNGWFVDCCLYNTLSPGQRLPDEGLADQVSVQCVKLPP